MAEIVMSGKSRTFSSFPPSLFCQAKSDICMYVELKKTFFYVQTSVWFPILLYNYGAALMCVRPFLCVLLCVTVPDRSQHVMSL